MPGFRSVVPLLLVLVASCDDPVEPRFEFEPEPLEDVDYDALGVGRLGFQRMVRAGWAYHVIDVAAETTYTHVQRGTSPALSPSGDRIAISDIAWSNFGEEIWNVFVRELDDTTGVELHGSPDDFDDSPTWTADGDSIVYSVRHVAAGDAAALRRVPASGGVATTMASIPHGEIHSRASGRPGSPWLIAMARYGATAASYQDGIFVVYPGLLAPEPLLLSRDVDPAASGLPRIEAPAWSPDGTRIAFLYLVWHESHSETRLYVLNVATDSTTLLASFISGLVEWGGRDQRSVAWAPDGSRIAFTTYDGDLESHLYVIRPDGSDLRQVTTRPGVADFSVTWVP